VAGAPLLAAVEGAASTTHRPRPAWRTDAPSAYENVIQNQGGGPRMSALWNGILDALGQVLAFLYKIIRTTASPSSC
jgi:hypothetical protein